MNITSRRRWTVAPIAAAALVPLVLGGVSTVAWAAEPEPELRTPATVDAAAPESPTVQVPAADVPEPTAPVPVAAPVEAPADATSEEPAPVEQPRASVLPEPAPAASTNDPQDPAPQVRFTVPDPVPDESWYDDTVEVVISATSGISTLESLTWETTGAQAGGATVAGGHTVVTIDAQGSTRLSAYAVDGEGYVSETVDVLIKIDRTPPTMDVAAPWVPGAHRFGTPIVVEYVCADPESGIDRTNVDQCGVEFHLNGVNQGGTYTGSTWTPRKQGVYEVWVYARNNSGLTTRINLGLLNVLPDESVAPTVEVSAPTIPGSGWYAQSIDLQFEAEDAGAGVDYVEYRAGEPGAWGPWVAVRGDVATVPVTSSGIHHVQARAADYFGNVSEIVERSVSVDVTAPAVDVTGPADGIRVAVGAELLLSYTCTDALSGVASCGGTAESGGPLDTSEPGTFEAVVIATDKAGNRTEVRRSYIVDAPDATGPTTVIDYVSPPASGWHDAPAVPFRITAHDPSGVEGIRYLVTNPAGQTGEGSASGDSTNGLQITDEGVTSVTFWAIDALGNEGERRTVVFRLDRTAPAVGIHSPDNAPGLVVATSEFEQGDVVDFDFVCTDAVSGIASCESSTGGDTLPTDVLGTHTASVTAVDNAGLSTVETIEYEVVEAEGPNEQPQQPGNQPASGAGTADRLARTGSDLSTPLAFGGVLLIAGAFALFVGMMRRRA